MSNKRLARKRLFDIEKKGIDVDVSPGIGFEKAIISATQHREGHRLETDIVVDLGKSDASLVTAGFQTGRICGEAGALSKICTLDHTVFGVVTEIRVICLEQITTNGTKYSQFDILSGSDGDGVQDGSDGTSFGYMVDLSAIDAAVGKDISKFFDVNTDTSGKALYLGSGNAIGSKASGSATVTIENATEAAHFNDGSRLTLFDETGAKYDLIIDKTNLAYNASAVPFKIGLLNADNIQKIELGFNAGIEATNTNFAVHHAAEDGTLTITAKSGTGAAGNNASHGNDNAYTPNGSETATITVGNFTGGTTPGLTSAAADASFTGGKFLIRVEGFLAPADL